MSRAVMLAASLILATAARADDKGALVREWNAPFAPFRIVDDLYYVGTAELASYLLATPEGSILVDSGVEESAEQIVAGIRALGFKPENVKWIVNSQAHFDHAAANPFVDPEACRSALAGAEARFREHLAGERAAK